MRSLVAVAALLSAIPFAASARAEERIFVISNNADGYGVDRCLARDEQCGRVVADAYCQSQSFAQASSFRKVEREEITGAVAANGKEACKGSCDEFVAITCSR